MRTQIGATTFPDAPGVYIVYEDEASELPLYVGVAARQTLGKRWRSNHLAQRAGSSALRRTLGVHLGLVESKLRRPERYYPAEVEAEITRYLEVCWIELLPTSTGDEAKQLEAATIARLDPLLNVAKPRIS